MARIKINDLPKDMKISKDDMRHITGGTIYTEGEITNIADDNVTYNLTYLQLQNDMQAQNRQFTLVSNIMKTKHDTAKAAINNVR